MKETEKSGNCSLQGSRNWLVSSTYIASSNSERDDLSQHHKCVQNKRPGDNWNN